MQKLSSRLTRFGIVTAFVCMLLPAFAEGGGVGGGNLPPPPVSSARIVLQAGATHSTPAIPSAFCQ